MYRIIFLVLALSLRSAFQLAPVERNADDNCIRKDEKSGYCIHMDNCSFLRNKFDQRRHQGIAFTPDETCYVKNSGCPVHKKGHVCCESEDKVAQGTQILLSEDCGTFSRVKVTQGREVALMSRPWMALLKFRIKSGIEDFTCGGTIINKRYILTAAHCFNNQVLLSVRLGEHNITSEIDCVYLKGQYRCAPAVQDFEVERVFIHEQYSPQTAHNDIALVKLKTEVNTAMESIRPICLPVNETLQRNGEAIPIFFVSGWGKTESGFDSDVLLEARVSSKDHTTCQSSFERNITSSQICAGDIGKDCCNGDSGGPLTYVDIFNGQQRFVQFGIVSFGSRRCGDGNPGVYTKIGSYIPWIAYKIATK